jgi:hypothetical protein
MNTAIAALLQITATFLLGVQRNPSVSLAVQRQAVSVGSRVVQLSTQDLASISFAVPQDNSAWPNIVDLQNAPYLNAEGQWVRLGQGVQLISSSTSFGDLNGDGLDDAAALVKRSLPDGSSDFALAAFLNQGGILFNIADAPLGNTVQIFNHSIQDGELIVDVQVDGQARAVRHYELLGNAFGENQ